MYFYLAVTNDKLINCKRLLKISDEGDAYEYFPQKKSWEIPTDAIGGIYTGEIETIAITKEEADKLIERIDSHFAN